jgi:hypothetical protein
VVHGAGGDDVLQRSQGVERRFLPVVSGTAECENRLPSASRITVMRVLTFSPALLK